MFENTCTFPLQSELFAQTIHPSEPLLAVGLSSGHVSTIRLPSADEDEGSVKKKRRGSDGTAIVDTLWKTKRHEDSCRCLAYSLDGNTLFSGGSEGMIKAADSETGRVIGKILLPAAAGNASVTGASDPPTVLHALSPQTFIATTDSGAMHLYDLRNPASDPTAAAGGKTAFLHTAPAQTHYPHIDYVSSLTPLPASSTSTSGFSKQWITTGGMSLAVTDLRRGVLVKSIDQAELLLSSVYVTWLQTKNKSGKSGERAVVGDAHGGITVWEKGEWQDMDERITVSSEQETLDVLAVEPDGGTPGKRIAAGLGDGKIRFVQLGRNQVVAEVQHDELEGVVALGFDSGGRMVSGGGRVVKVWEEGIAGVSDEEDEDEEEGESEEEVNGIGNLKRRTGSSDGSDSDNDDEQDSSEEEEEEEEKPQKRKKKRKKGKATKNGSNGVRFSFDGLD